MPLVVAVMARSSSAWTGWPAAVASLWLAVPLFDLNLGDLPSNGRPSWHWASPSAKIVSAASRREWDDKMGCFCLPKRSGLVCQGRRTVLSVVGLLSSSTTAGES